MKQIQQYMEKLYIYISKKFEKKQKNFFSFVCRLILDRRFTNSPAVISDLTSPSALTQSTFDIWMWFPTLAFLNDFPPFGFYTRLSSYLTCWLYSDLLASNQRPTVKVLFMFSSLSFQKYLWFSLCSHPIKAHSDSMKIHVIKRSFYF